MKFLCVDCDQAMALTETRGPDNGSLTVVFRCPQCHRKIAMLTNSMETQMVHSLGVSIGGRDSEVPPMETIQSSLVGYDDAGDTNESRNDGGQSSTGCPFSATVAESGAAPLTDVLEWTHEAENRMSRIPSFIRSMVQKGVEDYARNQGETTVDVEMLEAVRKNFGM